MDVSQMLNEFIHTLQSLAFNFGSLSISLYDIIRVCLVGLFVIIIARIINNYGKGIIKRQKRLDVRTKEVLTKVYEVVIFCIVALMLLNILGINLTTLAVFGGAVGVGLGLGLQSIASNFISGIIILLDNSITIDDYIEINADQKGFVREFRMRYTVLETYDGKDIVVPNETFISSTFINWSHKDPKQRYRVDFSVAYDTDVRAMVELIKEAVGAHPQVINGEKYPIEERPDCEIDSFGDSGINMFVEFWILGIDDGKNRVGGDLNLIILETLKNNGIEIPFPQREVKIISSSVS
jgi:small-conductance mechanosensitive channel